MERKDFEIDILCDYSVKMIDAFELVKDYSPSYEEDIRTVDQGVELFCKYYRELSDLHY